MKHKISLVILLIGILFSIYNFLYGFLINRSEIYEVNVCHINSNYCKYSPYKRIVLLLVDSLKYEFIDPNMTNSNYYQGHVEVIKSLIKKKSTHVHVSHFLSDPPTTTLQRIKGLMTGSLPTFIDISTNFGSSELLEDNIINQWQKSGFDLKFVGDDTWMDLFPNKFNTSSPFPSFNIKDLDLIDRKVEEFVINALSKPIKASHDHPEVIIGHMLGIDHCGHTFGKNHPQMKRKLIELNDFVKKIVKFIDKDSLFVMFGDHGMTKYGDHGGDSTEEVDAGLFVMSGKRINGEQSLNGNIATEISQVDLVSTLAAMTGVAIPFSNLGVIRAELLTSIGRARLYTELNVKQISDYINYYETKFGNLGFPDHIKIFFQNQKLNNNTEYSIKILQQVKQHFQSKWAQFNLPLIYGGIISFFLYLISSTNLLLKYRFHSTCDNKRFFLIILYLSASFLQILFKSNYYFSYFFGTFTIIEIFYLFQNRISLDMSDGDKMDSVIYIIGLLNTLLTFANSFIVSEDKIMQFFLQTILIVKTIQSILPLITEISIFKSKKPDRNLTGIKFNFQKCFFIILSFLMGSFCLHFGLSYKICREEQRSWCSYSNSPDKVLQFALFLIPVVTALHRLWLRHCGNLASTDCNSILVKFLLPFSTLCLFFFQAMQFSNESSAFSEVASMVLLIFPRIILFTSLSVLIYLIISPLLILHRKPFESLGAVDVPSIFRYLKSVQCTDSAITVHGLGTVYSSFILTGLLSSFILVSIFLKLQFVIGLLSTIGVLFSYSFLANLSMKVNKDNIYQCIPIAELVIFMVILTQYGFFATGHQTTISNIPWYSVFIGWKADHSTRIIPAIMLNINLFSAQIVITLFGLLLPLFILLISYGPANPFGNQRATSKNTDDNIVSSVSCGDFFLFKTDSEAVKFRHWVQVYYLFYVVYHSIVTWSSVLSTGYSRRHLMAFKIFVPKMIYSVLNLFVVYLMSMLSYFFIMRIHGLSLKWRSKNI